MINIVKKTREEIEKNNRLILHRRQLEKDNLQVVLQDNEFNKRRQKDLDLQEKKDDVKVTGEYTEMINRQDDERNNFFSNKMRKPNEVTKQLVQDVLNNMEEKRQLEDQKILYYGNEKERK
jgi:membrane-bound lytic murein transglycosylase